MQLLENPYRRAQRQIDVPKDTPFPSDNPEQPAALLSLCPEAAVTPLVTLDNLGDVERVYVKDERTRMGLGSFKALGAAYVIACDARDGVAKGRTYITASAGNHGLSVATGAQIFDAQSAIFIAQSVPESFADRLRQVGAEVFRAGATYEDSMQAASDAAEKNGWHLLSDSSWPGYFDPPWRVMEGYLALMGEVFDQLNEPPTHVFLQAGVGGLAGACAAAIRSHWGQNIIVVVVEPEAAAALMNSVQQGRCVTASGPVSNMGRLDCKEPSLIALKGLARDADWFCTLSEDEALLYTQDLERFDLATSPSGGAGLAALIAASGNFGLDQNSRALCILSEGPVE